MELLSLTNGLSGNRESKGRGIGLRAVPELFPKTVSFQTIKKVEEWPISPNGQTLTTDVISRDHSPFHTLSFQSCLPAVLFSFSLLFSWITLTQTLGLRLEILPVGALPPPSPVWARYFFSHVSIVSFYSSALITPCWLDPSLNTCSLRKEVMSGIPSVWHPGANTIGL